MAALAMLLLTCFTPVAARAASHGPSADPLPQKAPVSPLKMPAPDPAPQAVPRLHSSPPTSTSISVPTTVTLPSAPPVHAAAPAEPSAEAPPQASVSTVRPVHRTPPPRHASKAAPTRPHHAPPARHAAANGVSLSFLAFLTKDLLRLPHVVLHSDAENRRDGMLLLLSSLAMAVLAVSSFTLLRRLRQLQGRR